MQLHTYLRLRLLGFCLEVQPSGAASMVRFSQFASISSRYFAPINACAPKKLHQQPYRMYSVKMITMQNTVLLQSLYAFAF